MNQKRDYSKVDAFGHPFCQACLPSESQDQGGKIIKYGLEHDKETGNTIPVVAEEIDIAELVNSFKEQTGVEQALRLISSGQATADQFADDGKHGADLTQIPDYAGDLLRQNIELQAQKELIKEQYGLSDADLEGKDLEAVIKAAVEKRLADIKAQAADQKEGE